MVQANTYVQRLKRYFFYFSNRPRFGLCFLYVTFLAFETPQNHIDLTFPTGLFSFGSQMILSRNCIDKISSSTEQTEITGPADAEHLSQFAPFRRARTTIETTKSITGSKTSSSQHESVPLVVRTLTSPTATRPTGVSDHPPTSLPSDYSAMSDQPGEAVRATPPAATFYRSGEGDGAVALGTNMPLPEDSGIPQPSMNHYIRTADEMSGYLTWQTTELPPWFNYDSQFPNN